MKASGARNRQRKRNAEQQRFLEMNTMPKQFWLLPPAQQQEAQEIMDLIYWGFLTDPDQEKIEPQAEEEHIPALRKKQKKKRENLA